ncbi:MAG: hypothetical protein Q9175_001670 [Cornicularia normoerica]
MAPSSLKKMSGVQARNEGNYASVEEISRDWFTNYDLGLTLLPGSQIHRKDENRSGTAAESNPEEGSSYVGSLGQWKSFETEIQSKHLAQEAAFPNEITSLSSSADPGPEAAKVSPGTARINREGPFSQSAKDARGVVQYNVNCVIVAPCDEQVMGSGEIRNTKSCQHDDTSPRSVKRRKLGNRTSNEMRGSQVSKGKEAAFGAHYNLFNVHHDQHRSEINAIHTEKRKQLVATIGNPFLGIEGGLGSSKPELRRQITHTPDTAITHSHQSTILGIEGTALHRGSSVLAASASRSSAKHQHSEPEKLTVHYRPSISSKSASAQHPKDSRLFSDTSADIRTQVLKPRNKVRRSLTSHFPAKAKIPRSANLPASSLLAATFTPNADHRHAYPISAPLTSTNLHSCTHFSSTHPSPSLPNYFSLSEAFNYSSDICALADIFDTAHTGNQRQSSRRRSASVPNLSSTCAPMNMDSSNSFGPASLPTPPREQPSFPAYLPCANSLSHYDDAPFRQNPVGPSRGHADASFNADNSFSQNWQFNSMLERQHEISLSNRQNIGFTSRPHPRQVLTQPSNHQDMTGPSVSLDGAMAADRRLYCHRRLEIKPKYSHEEVKSLMLGLGRQAQTLKAENTSLQSVNTAMKKGLENLQQDKANMSQQIQHYERTVAQKDQQIEAMRQNGSSLQRQYNRIWNEFHQLVETTRKANGNSKPSEIAEKIRWNHSLNAVDAASQGRRPEAKASPVYRANGAQLPIPRPGFEQTPTGVQGNVRPVSVPGYSGATVANPSSRTSMQPGFSAANHNGAKSQHIGSTQCLPSDQPPGATVRTMITDGQSNDRPTEQVPRELVTIDLTDDSQPFSSSTSRNASVHQTHQTRQSSFQDEYPPSHLSPDQYTPAQYPAGHFVSSQYPSGPSAQKQISQSQFVPDQDSQDNNLEAIQIQKKAIARMAQKPLSWLEGENPFRRGTKIEQQVGLSISKWPSQNNEEEQVLFAQYPETGSVAPLPETVTGRKTKKKAPKKPKVVLDAEAKKERAKGYRKTAAEKKKREKEIAKQLLKDEDMSNNAMRAQKQDRRAAKEGRRQDQAGKQSEEVGPREPQKTLDGRLYQEDTGIQRAILGGSIEQADSDDKDSLFGDSEEEAQDFVISPDADIVMRNGDAAATEQDKEATYAAEIEAEFEADVDAGRMAGFQQSDAASGQTSIPTTLPDGDEGYHDFSSESEESEEE